MFPITAAAAGRFHSMHFVAFFFFFFFLSTPKFGIECFLFFTQTHRTSFCRGVGGVRLTILDDDDDYGWGVE